MPLVAYDSSDDEDSQGDEKIESTSTQPSSTAILPAKVVSVPVKGLGNQVKNQSSGQSLSNRQSGTLNGLPVPGSAISGYNDNYGIEDDDNGGNVDFLSSAGKQMDGDDDLESIESSSKLLGKLPGKKQNPTSSILTAGLNDIVVVDKKSKKVRVVIPSLDELEYASEEEEEEELALKRKIILSSKSGGVGCSLSSLLPKPKNVRSGSSSLFSSVTTNSSSPSSNIPVKSVISLVPHSVSRPKANIPPPQNVITEPKAESKQIGLDFFALDEVPKKSTETHLNTHIESIKPIIISKPEIEEQPTYTEGTNYYAYPQPASSSTSSSSQNPKFHPSTADINDMEYKKFIASKFGEETADKIDIVEVDIKSYLANENELIKSISMESGGTVAGPAPSALAKRKNQITYLAYQAKQREVDLKNEASNNRFTKSQTRAKYGF